MRVVIDTNVWIQWETARQVAYRCVQLCRAGKAEVFYCNEAIAELTDKLRFKFRYSENWIHYVVYTIDTFAHAVPITGTLHVVPRDPDDDKFVECAVVAQADYIITNDRHLLDLVAYQNIRFIIPLDFLALLEAESQDESET